MADRELGTDTHQALPVAPTTNRRSVRKRKVVASYANDYSQSSDEIVKPQTQLSRKRKKAIPDLEEPELANSKPTIKTSIKSSTKPSTKLGRGKGKANAPSKHESEGKNKVIPILGGEEEKRLKRFKPKMPQSFETTMERAVTQRMFVIDRKRHNNEDCVHATPECPMEVVDLAGTTGNCYQVVITHCPTCTCPNFVKGNPQCKHILYVLIKVLKVNSDLQYQSAFLTSELREIFENAGPLPSDTITSEDKDGKRKPIEGDCPICVEELDPKTEEIVWCHAACGNNLHKTCLDQWAASKRGDKVTCPYCRTAWEGSIDAQAIKAVSKTGDVNEDGYVNIAGQLGISGRRDYSSYHGFWVRREHRAGRIHSEDAAPHHDYGYRYRDY